MKQLLPVVGQLLPAVRELQSEWTTVRNIQTAILLVAPSLSVYVTYRQGNGTKYLEI